eukprot:778425_1
MLLWIISFFTFLEIVTLSIEQLAATLVQSEYSKSDQFPHDKAKKWIDYLAQTVRTMHVIIPRLTYLIQEDISSNHCKLSKQSLYLFENIVTLVRTMIVFKSNINIASKVFMYRTSSTKKIIHVAMLVHGVNGKAIVLQSLLNKLGYDNKNIHRFEATLNQNYKRARKKSLFNFVPLRTIPHESELSDVDYVSTSSALSVQTCTNMTITVFVVKPASPQYLHDLERELVLRQVGDMILIKFEQTLSTAEVKKTVKMEPKMSIISYHEHIDMILEETLWFLKSINDLENNVSLQLQFGSMMVHDLRKIHQTQWDAAYSFLYRKYHNKSSDHQKILQHWSKIDDEKYETSSNINTTKEMLADLVLMTFGVTLKIELHLFEALVDKYAKEKNFAPEWIKITSFEFVFEVIKKIIHASGQERFELLSDLTETCLKFEMLKSILDIGMALDNWRTIQQSGPQLWPGGCKSISVAVYEDQLSRFVNLLHHIGYKTIHTVNATYIGSSDTRKYQFEFQPHLDNPQPIHTTNVNMGKDKQAEQKKRKKKKK